MIIFMLYLIMEKKIFYINSTNRLSGTNSNFSYSMQQPSSANFDYCAILQASIPKSFYSIVTGLNTFTLSENGTLHTITIPIGCYNRTGFKTQLASLLNAGGSYTYAVGIDDSTSGPETGKFTFTVTNNSGHQPLFIFTTFVYEQMGFNINSSNAFIAGSLVSTNVMNLQRESTIYIHSDISTNGTDNILQEIFTTDTSDYGNIVFVNPDVEYYKKKITKLSNSYTFFLTDENGIQIDLNGRNWQIVLCMFAVDNTNEMFKKYMKLQLMS